MATSVARLYSFVNVTRFSGLYTSSFILQPSDIIPLPSYLLPLTYNYAVKIGRDILLGKSDVFNWNFGKWKFTSYVPGILSSCGSPYNNFLSLSGRKAHLEKQRLLRLLSGFLPQSFPA